MIKSRFTLTGRLPSAIGPKKIKEFSSTLIIHLNLRSDIPSVRATKKFLNQRKLTSVLLVPWVNFKFGDNFKIVLIGNVK